MKKNLVPIGGYSSSRVVLGSRDRSHRFILVANSVRRIHPNTEDV